MDFAFFFGLWLTTLFLNGKIIYNTLKRVAKSAPKGEKYGFRIFVRRRTV